MILSDVYCKGWLPWIFDWLARTVNCCWGKHDEYGIYILHDVWIAYTNTHFYEGAIAYWMLHYVYTKDYFFSFNKYSAWLEATQRFNSMVYNPSHAWQFFPTANKNIAFSELLFYQQTFKQPLYILLLDQKLMCAQFYFEWKKCAQIFSSSKVFNWYHLIMLWVLNFRMNFQ